MFGCAGEDRLSAVPVRTVKARLRQFYADQHCSAAHRVRNSAHVSHPFTALEAAPPQIADTQEQLQFCGRFRILQVRRMTEGYRP